MAASLGVYFILIVLRPHRPVLPVKGAWFPPNSSPFQPSETSSRWKDQHLKAGFNEVHDAKFPGYDLSTDVWWITKKNPN